MGGNEHVARGQVLRDCVTCASHSSPDDIQIVSDDWKHASLLVCVCLESRIH